MKSKYIPMGILKSTHDLLKKVKKQTGVPFYRIIADGVAMYARVHKAQKPVKFTMGFK